MFQHTCAKYQYIIKKNKSTEDALTLMSNVIYGQLDKSIKSP